MSPHDLEIYLPIGVCMPKIIEISAQMTNALALRITEKIVHEIIHDFLSF